MRLIITGSDKLPDDIAIVQHAIEQSPFIGDTLTTSNHDPLVIYCGCTNDGDMLGFKWARSNNFHIEFFPAWGHHLIWALRNKLPKESVNDLPVSKNWRANGLIRNTHMTNSANGILSLGTSAGATDAISKMQKQHKLHFVLNPVNQVQQEAIPAGRKDVPSLAVDLTATLVQRNPPRPVGRTAIGT